MRTVVLGDHPPELQDWLDRRRALGQDRFDEVWEGDYHVNPAPHERHGRLDNHLTRMLGPMADDAGLIGAGTVNIGVADDYRIPDLTYVRPGPPVLYRPTAAIVVEIVSPGDESRAKTGFYFERGVDELLIVDPQQRSIEWYRRGATGFERAGDSRLLGITEAELDDRLDWPPAE